MTVLSAVVGRTRFVDMSVSWGRARENTMEEADLDVRGLGH